MFFFCLSYHILYIHCTYHIYFSHFSLLFKTIIIFSHSPFSYRFTHYFHHMHLSVCFVLISLFRIINYQEYIPFSFFNKFKLIFTISYIEVFFNIIIFSGINKVFIFIIYVFFLSSNFSNQISLHMLSMMSMTVWITMITTP